MFLSKRTAIAVTLAVGLAAPAAHATFINDWNLIVRGNVTMNGQVEGSTLIGGSLVGSGTFVNKAITAPDGVGLAVGGNLFGSFNVNQGGDLLLGGWRLAALNMNGGGSITADAGIGAVVADAFEEVVAMSDKLSTLPANGSLSPSGNLSATPTLYGSRRVAVYNLHNDDLQSLGQLTITLGSADSVIINVAAGAGGVVDLQGPPNLIGSFSQANSQKIMWNFFDATLVKVNNSFSGALVAPHADLKLSGGNVRGSVVADSISQMSVPVQYNLYSGFTPEPGSLVLMVGGALSLCLRRRWA